MLKRSLILMVLLAVGHGAEAQVSFGSVEDVWRYADDHNITMRIARQDMNKAVLGRKQAISALLPQVSATGTYTDNMSLQTTLLPGIIVGRNDGSYVPVQFGQKYIYTAGITAQMDVLNVQSWFNTRVARLSAEMSKDSLLNTKRNIYQQVATQYYTVILMDEAARLAAKSASIADSVFASVSNKFAEGTVGKSNADVAEINREKARQNSINATYQAGIAKNNLRILLDLKPEDSLNISGDLQPKADEERNAVFAEDPAVRLAYNAMRISMAQYRGYNGTFLPVVTALYSTSKQQNDNKFEPLQGSGPTWYPAQYWSLRASWTLFNSGGRYFQSKRNHISLEERKMQYESIKRQSAINDENVRLNYRKSVLMLEKSKHIMELSLDNYTHITNRYNEGISSLDDRLNAFTDYLNYQNQYLNSLSDMLVQLYQVKVRQLQ